MFGKPEGQRRWRIAMLIAMLVAFLSPWAFDRINVPAQYECSAPNIRLYGDFCGMRSAALRHYQVCCESLRRELDVEPSNATTTLYEEIKAWERGAFQDLELSQITDAPTKPKTIAEPDAVKNSTSYRKISRRSLMWLIAAGLILGIGSVY